MTLNEVLRNQPVQWHGIKLDSPDWSYESHVLAATVPLPGNQVLLHLMVNAYWKALQFEVPLSNGAYTPWRRCIDTFLDSPDDICEWAEASPVNASIYTVESRSIALLMAKMLQ